ncbi:hypothetical protein HA052_05020 [Chromobacterium haemolyticum]|uniref:Uncharacterized protein n=1 Tax=Chromobacterium fluminis TaxID=3044269 RepID=A0ABX0L0U4_9NEIS|nr:hypothetical protein [Chromobacterium haemolyticum]NHR04553.1 hypothetical protein [Chromobacterium haemolyticum]
MIPLWAMANPEGPSPAAQCRAGDDIFQDQIITSLTGTYNSIGLVAAFEAIAKAKAEPASPITLGTRSPKTPTGTLWLSLEDPDSASLAEEAIKTAGVIQIRLFGFNGQTPAKAALLHMVLEHKKFEPKELPNLVKQFQASDLFELLDKFDSLPKCARTAANLRVQADTNLATKKLGRLDLTVFVAGSTE